MAHTHRFICPECNIPESARKEEFIRCISDWTGSDALKDLTNAFGGDIPDSDLKTRIGYLNEFADNWDYRKKQASGGERWNVEEDPALNSNRELIMECVQQLGLTDITEPAAVPDYILPLGGARMSNYARPLKAKEVIDSNRYNGKNIVALSGTRPINDVERPFLAQYAPDADTEYDAMSRGLEKIFLLDKNNYTQSHHRSENINLEWAVKKYGETYSGNTVYSLAAPSTDPSRRANSRDTFTFFLKKFDIKKGDRLLLVTSCIYVPFQLLRFMDLAIEKGFYVDCIGMPNDNNAGTAFSHLTNYLQETKAAINGIKALSDLWL